MPVLGRDDVAARAYAAGLANNPRYEAWWAAHPEVHPEPG